MRSRTYFLSASALLLGGCDLVRMLLPRNATTSVAAREALERCGIASDSIAWSVSADGTFAFGRKSADAAPWPEAQNDCLMRWIKENRIKVAFIGWETGPQ
jgi:hypothetical protein